MKERMSLHKWYGSSVRIPRLGTAFFAHFVVSSLGLTNSILERFMRQEVRVKFARMSKSASAYADQENNLIMVNQDFLEGVFPQASSNNSSQVITIILGIEVHETGHFAFSPKDLQEYIDFIDAGKTTPYHEETAKVISNVIEDLYIEAELDRCVPSLTWMVEQMNEFFFSDDIAAKTIEQVTYLDSAPATMIEVLNLLNLLVLTKSQREFALNPFLTSLVEGIRSAKEMTSYEDRKVLALSIYDTVMANVSNEEMEKCNSESAAMKKLLDEVMEFMKGLTASHEDRDEDMKRKIVKGEFTVLHESGVCRAVTDYQEKTKDAVFTVTEEQEWTSSSSAWVPTTLFVEEIMKPDTEEMEVDARYHDLAQIARQRATVNKPYGEDRNRGTHLRKLYRIATDQKIFAEQIAMRHYKPMQVCILVDCSGSMGSGYGSRLYEACSAALGAAMGLSAGHCDVAVYGHTAEILGGSDVTICRAKSFNESLSLLSQRMSSMSKTMTLQNRDGFAIQYVAEKLTDKRKRRVLVVISDGAPYAHFGYESDGIRHTKNAVENVRSKGIDVFSISITSGAASTNAHIYGKAWNVCNDDPHVIADLMSKLLMS